MAIAKTTVTGPILDATGAAYSAAYIRFTPSAVGRDDADDTVIVQGPVEVAPDPSTGAFSIDLAPSDTISYSVSFIGAATPLGGASKSTIYKIGLIYVPSSGPVALEDLLPVYSPDLPTNAELLAALSTAVTEAETAETNAATSATTASAAAVNAALGTPYGFETVPLLVADVVMSYTAGAGLEVVTSGQYILAGGWRYKVAASGATDHHLTTAGGVKLYVQAGAGGDNAAAFGIPADGTAANMTLVDVAFAAADGKSLHFPSGTYDFSRAPAGVDDVFVTSDPFVTFSDYKLATSAPVATGGKQTALVAGVLRYYDATATNLGHGYQAGETVSIVSLAGGTGGTATVTVAGDDDGVNAVTLAAGGSGYTNGSQALLVGASGTGCRVLLTVSSGVITALAKHSGWYFLNDGQEEHDPILLTAVAESGDASLRISTSFVEDGLDPNSWTPSGFLVGCDETLANSGAVFGASVSPTSIAIEGTYSCASETYVSWNGSSWSFSGVAYTPTFGNGVLTLTRGSSGFKAARNFSPSVRGTLRVQSAADWGANKITIDLYASTSTAVSFIFTDIDGNRVTTPDARMKFWMSDSAVQNPNFNFGDDPGGGTNIWLSGLFVRRKGFYP